MVVVAPPVESFTVVMATGIVAVAARDDHHPVLALVLALAASGVLVGILGWAGVARVLVGHAVAPSSNPIYRACGLFGSVAAIDVVAAQLGPSATGIVATLGAAALATWVGLLPRLVGAIRTAGYAGLSGDARGSWLLVPVATQSLVLVAAHFTAAGNAAGGLVVAAVVGWMAGVLVYVPIAVLVTQRLLRDRLAPTQLTPDVWVLMGALAIAVVAGGSLVRAIQGLDPYAGLAAVGSRAVLVCWLASSAWIPLLLAVEALRACHGRPRYEVGRWATVFPLGMYAVACATLTSIVPALHLRTMVSVTFWVALAVWSMTTAGLLTRLEPRDRGRT